MRARIEYNNDVVPGRRKPRVELSREQTQWNVIRAWESGRVRINEHWVDGNVIVTPDEIVPDWVVADPAAVATSDLEPAIERKPEIIVLGMGETMRTPDVELMAALAEHAIGLEIMSTPAACRTFNVLVHEERRVIAALING